jgi:hypothetical protein
MSHITTHARTGYSAVRVSRQVITALETLVDHNWEKEKEDFELSGGDAAVRRAPHKFEYLRRIKQWMDGLEGDACHD